MLNDCHLLYPQKLIERVAMFTVKIGLQHFTKPNIFAQQ